MSSCREDRLAGELEETVESAIRYVEVDLRQLRQEQLEDGGF